jgi:hypothetical protein
MEYHTRKQGLIACDAREVGSACASAIRELKVHPDDVSMVSYRHVSDTSDTPVRFAQQSNDPLPQWAADVTEHCPSNGSWISAESVKELAMQLDVAMNGEHAAKSPSLCDVVAQAVKLLRVHTEDDARVVK